jgi:AcrR family transcriptional regulator
MNTKDHILSEARKVFEKFGFNKTSMADIALAARKGRRTIYTYFTSKEEVFRAVIDVEVNALAVDLQEIIHSNLPPTQKLRSYMHARMNAVKELTIYYDALRQDLLGNFGMIENLRRDYDELEVSMIKNILDEGVKKDDFAIDDTHLVANAIVLATKGFELPLYMGQTGYDHEQLIDPLMNLFYKGILKTN